MKYIATISNVLFYTAVWLPLHIGVALFTLISGYWGLSVMQRIVWFDRTNVCIYDSITFNQLLFAFR